MQRFDYGRQRSRHFTHLLALMPWIRSPWWDGAWVLSGVAIGCLLILATVYVAPRVLILFGAGLLGTAHLISPIALVWGRPDLRAMALSKPVKFIGLPLLLLAVAAIVGSISAGLPLDAVLDFSKISVRSPADFGNPLIALMFIYVVWNAYHFGMQNFGVLSIYRAKSGGGRRSWDMIFCLVMITAATLLPFAPRLPFALYSPIKWGVIALAAASIPIMLSRELRFGPRTVFIVTTALGPPAMLWWGFLAFTMHNSWPWFQGVPFWPFIWGFALISMNHWLVSIGLASHVYSRQRRCSPLLFLVAVAILGSLVFIALFVNPHTLVMHITAMAIALRLGLGFVHFLYDRWLYKFSDPQVRATIGRDIFSLAPISCEPSVPSS
jgi:hypothetical protein